MSQHNFMTTGCPECSQKFRFRSRNLCGESEDASNIDEGKKKAPLAPRSYCALCGHGYKVLPSLLLLHAIFVEISPCLPLCVYLPHTITVTPNLCLPLCLISIILLTIHPHNTKPSILASTHLIAKAPHKMFTP